MLLGPTATQLVAGNVEVALENFASVIDATGGVSHGGAARLDTDDGMVEVA